MSLPSHVPHCKGLGAEHGPGFPTHVCPRKVLPPKEKHAIPNGAVPTQTGPLIWQHAEIGTVQSLAQNDCPSHSSPGSTMPLPQTGCSAGAQSIVGLDGTTVRSPN